MFVFRCSSLSDDGVIGFAAGCNKSDVLLVWAHTQELKDIVEEYYFEAYPEKKEKVKVEVYPDDVFQTKLDGVLSTGINAPDVMILQIGFIQKYIEKGSLASLSSDGLGLSAYAEEKCYDYTIDVATGADGKLYGLAWQAIPGGYFYRRSVAEELWGQSDPEFVQSKLSTWDDFMEVAYELKNHGRQAHHVFFERQFRCFCFAKGKAVDRKRQNGNTILRNGIFRTLPCFAGRPHG